MLYPSSDVLCTIFSKEVDESGYSSLTKSKVPQVMRFLTLLLDNFTVPIQTHYAELAEFHSQRPRATQQIDPVLYATISAATHERTYGNVGHQKRQGK